VPEQTNGSHGLALSDVKELLSAFHAADVAELTLEHGDFRLCLKKQGGVATQVVMAAPAVAPAPVVAMAAPVAAAPVAPPAAAAEPAAPAAASAPAAKALTINSPMVGTFYRAPSPDAPSFVDVGDHVKPGQTVCIVEAMKLMNEIESEVSGRVVRVLVENGQPVEYGQPLVELEPA
jgi:acetyl-CoA carboxylase biotin carboxyl carrier protein